MKNRYLIFTAMGFELVGIILSCLYIGKLIDEKYQLNGIALAAVSLLGLAGWLFHLIKLTQTTSQQDDQN